MLVTVQDNRVSELERRCCEAHAREIRAERAYSALAGEERADQRTLDAAWLLLWRAQELQREADKALHAHLQGN
jgi:hypothetical protein